MEKLVLKRAYLPVATIGKLVLPSGRLLYTVEKPWKDNIPLESCVPEGTYLLKMRKSEVIHKTTRGLYSQGWEVSGVPGRSLIMVHVGNTTEDIQGCIAVGTQVGYVNGMIGVLRSGDAFDIFMKELVPIRSPQIIIKTRTQNDF